MRAVVKMSFNTRCDESRHAGQFHSCYAIQRSLLALMISSLRSRRDPSRSRRPAACKRRVDGKHPDVCSEAKTFEIASLLSFAIVPVALKTEDECHTFKVEPEQATRARRKSGDD